MCFSRGRKGERNYPWELVGEESSGLFSHTFGNVIHERRCLSWKANLSVQTLHFRNIHMRLQSSNQHQNLFFSLLFLIIFLPFLTVIATSWKENILSCALNVIFLLLKFIPFGLSLAELCNLH